MNASAIGKIEKQINKQYPATKGEKPSISKHGDDQFLLIFTTYGKTPDGMTIEQNIRVVATKDGQILKTSMSR